MKNSNDTPKEKTLAKKIISKVAKITGGAALIAVLGFVGAKLTGCEKQRPNNDLKKIENAKPDSTKTTNIDTVEFDPEAFSDSLDNVIANNNKDIDSLDNTISDIDNKNDQKYNTIRQKDKTIDSLNNEINKYNK